MAQRHRVYAQRGQRRLGDAADGEHQTGTNDVEHATQVEAALADLDGGRAAVGERLAGRVRVGRHRVPEHDVALGAELVEHSVDDGAGRLAPTLRPVGRELEG